MALIRTAPERHRIVLTNHHIVLDGWSLPILLQEIFASYYGHRLPAAVSYRRFVNGWPSAMSRRHMRPGGTYWPVSTPPPWSARRAGSALGPRGVESYRLPEQTTQALGELARSHHTTVNTVLQAAWAQTADAADRAARCRVRHRGLGAAHRGARRGIHGGPLINTVPVRAHITPATTTADLLDQLQSAHNHTLDHQHLALTEIHRATGHDQLFDTLFVYENYPLDTARTGRHRRVGHHRVHRP